MITKRLRSFRVTDEDWQLILKRANRYCAGNVSEWLRLAALEHVPMCQAKKKPAKKGKA